MSDVQISLELVTKAFKDALRDAGKQTQEFQETAKSSFSGISSAFNVMAGNLLAAGITKTIGAISNSIGTMVDEAIQAEESVNNLNVALRNSNQYTVSASNKMQEYAESLAKVSTYDDDLIIQNQALLLSLTKLNTDGVNKAVKSAADLAATLNIDLGTATEMVARAINGNTVAFSKMGIQIAKSKDDTQQFNNVMDALSKFSGNAEAKTNTFSGALVQNRNAFNNMLGSIGQMITTSPAVIKSLAPLIAWKSSIENPIWSWVSK